jgi:protein-S-isoprenylcysteine O-methyltransferase Ste14
LRSRKTPTRRILIGWGLVLFQFLLIAVWILSFKPLELHLLDAPPVESAVRILGLLLAFGGAALSAGGALWLGPSLTPTPVPRKRSMLIRSGPYRYVRHPIYGGLMLLIVGATLFAFQLAPFVVVVLIALFFLAKSEYEEQLLTYRYPDYPSFAASRKRFIPRIW